MKIPEICRDIGRRLKNTFPDSVMYAEDISHGAEGNFLLVISEITGGVGITPRKKRSVSFDIVYFSKPRDTLGFAEWSERMENTLPVLEGGGQLFHTLNRRAIRTDMQYHFMFEINAEFIDYTTEVPEMGEMEERIVSKN